MLLFLAARLFDKQVFFSSRKETIMGNKVSQGNEQFTVAKPTSFMVLAKDVKPGFFNAIVKKKWFANLTSDEQDQLNCAKCTSGTTSNATTCSSAQKWSSDMQIYEVGTALNWLVLGPIIAAAVLLLLAIFYMSQKSKTPQYA